MRRRAIVAGALLAAAALVWLVLRDPLDGKTRFVRDQAPSFNLLYKQRPVHVVRPRGDELLRLVTRRGGLRGEAVVRMVPVPPHEGDIAGALPLVGDRIARELAPRYDGFQLVDDTRARVHTAPGYEIGFSYRDGATRRGEGTELVVVEPEKGREAVQLSLRITKPDGRQPRRVRKAARALRSAFRSFEFGPDRL
jgi:hypothetical protein